MIRTKLAHCWRPLASSRFPLDVNLDAAAGAAASVRFFLPAYGLDLSCLLQTIEGRVERPLFEMQQAAAGLVQAVEDSSSPFMPRPFQDGGLSVSRWPRSWSP